MPALPVSVTNFLEEDEDEGLSFDALIERQEKGLHFSAVRINRNE